MRMRVAKDPPLASETDRAENSPNRPGAEA